jgi:hypothetical protein
MACVFLSQQEEDNSNWLSHVAKLLHLLKEPEVGGVREETSG